MKPSDRIYRIYSNMRDPRGRKNTVAIDRQITAILKYLDEEYEKNQAILNDNENTTTKTS